MTDIFESFTQALASQRPVEKRDWHAESIIAALLQHERLAISTMHNAPRLAAVLRLHDDGKIAIESIGDGSWMLLSRKENTQWTT
jgi:hypothetical protein